MRILLVLLVFVMASSSLSAGIVEEYQKRYDFISMDDTIFTFESEFVLPEGFSYPFNDELTGFQIWLREFPLWHQWKWVGSYRGGKAFESKEIARPVHLPWDGHRYTDRGFMVRILAEYFRFTGLEDEFSFKSKSGDPVDLATWLSGKPSYSSHGKLLMKPGAKREKTENEFYSLVHFLMDDGNYISLAANLDTVSLDELSIGDMIVSHDKTGKNGKVYIMVNMARSNDGEKIFALATGCAEACDLYIPKFNKEKNSPWLSLKEIHRFTGDFEHSGYYRFNNTPNN